MLVCGLFPKVHKKGLLEGSLYQYLFKVSYCIHFFKLPKGGILNIPIYYLAEIQLKLETLYQNKFITSEGFWTRKMSSFKKAQMHEDSKQEIKDIHFLESNKLV